MAELEELEQEDLDEQLLQVEPAIGEELPSVPTVEPVAPKPSKSPCWCTIPVFPALSH